MDYTTLIPPPNRQKPKFSAVVDLLCNGVGAITAAATQLQTVFDVDYAQGEQLDMIGLWVGASRRLPVPLNIFFSWDTVNLGWDQGQWNGANQPGTTTVLLDDETYRSLMKTIILANHWDGTLVQYQTILQAFFPNNTFYAVDNQDMTMDIFVDGPPLTNLQLAVMQPPGPLSRIKPVGVGINFDPTYDFGFSDSDGTDPPPDDTEGFGFGSFTS